MNVEKYMERKKKIQSLSVGCSQFVSCKQRGVGYSFKRALTVEKVLHMSSQTMHTTAGFP